MNIINRIFWRMQYEKSKKIPLDKIHAFYDPKNLDVFFRLDQYLTEKTKTRLESLYRLRLREIDQVICRYGVKSVREMGAGRTTFFFNLFREVDVISYEQDDNWRKLLLEFYEENDLPAPRIEGGPVEKYRNGGRFVSLEDTRCDLLYIDGPYVNQRGGKLNTHTGKPAYYDFERVLDAGLPKVIMVEGRTDTVDAILASSYAHEYDFSGELTWALERSRYLHALRLSRHSIFVRRS